MLSDKTEYKNNYLRQKDQKDHLCFTWPTSGQQMHLAISGSVGDIFVLPKADLNVSYMFILDGL